MFYSDWIPNDGIEDGDDVDENLLTTFNGREGTIYLIDVGKYGNQPENSIITDNEQFMLCLDCIEADMLKSILINPKDLVSVVFYNTQFSPPASNLFVEDEAINTVTPSNCAVLIPLRPLNKDLIQYFKSFKESNDFFEFEHTFGSSDESCFSEALWLCSRLFIQSNYKLSASKILLFTNNELPHPNGTQEQQQAFIRAKDLCENNVSVELVPMVDEFNIEPFFKEFLCAVDEIDDDQLHLMCPKDQRYQLLNRIYRANFRKACLRHLNFEIADGISMSCDVFSFTRSAKKPNTIKMFRSNNEIVIGKRSYVVNNPETDDDRKILPGELFKSQTICGKEIVFNPMEVIAMKSMQNPGIRLLGFKPLDQLENRWMIKHCLFLYPNEKKAIGSTTLFRAIWEKCLEKQMFALCALTMTRISSPK